MKTIFLLLFFTFYSYSLADEVPITIGMGSDTVWLKTGIKPIGNNNSILVPKYGVEIVYGPEKTVESILLSSAFSWAGKRYVLNRIVLGENKKDVVNKLGQPTKEFPKDKDEVEDVYESVWVFKDQLLEVGFWQTDQVTPDKHVKDSVVWVTLRKAHL